MPNLNGWQYGDIGCLGIEFWGHPVTRITSDLYTRLGKPGVDTFGKVIEDELEPVSAEAAKDDVWLVELPSGLWLVANEAGGWTFMLSEDY